MEKLYEHHLGVDGQHFTAFNMCYGAFGGSDGRDVFLVQSLDGKIQIIEQTATAFSRQFHDCLIPGPIAYLPTQDAFVTATYANHIECYRYQVLANSQADVGAKDAKLSYDEKQNGGRRDGPGSNLNAFGLVSVRNAMVEWSINVGEMCYDIIEGKFSKGKLHIPPAPLAESTACLTRLPPPAN